MNSKREIAKLTPRVMGGLIDLLIILSIVSVLMFMWGLIVGASGNERHLSAEQAEVLWNGRGVLVGLLIDLIYTVGMQNSSTRATFGQKWMGLQIVSDAYQHVGLGKLIIRYVVSLFSSIILKIGYIFAIFTSKNQTLHDLVAGTIVIMRDDENIISKNNFNPTPNIYTASTPPLRIKPSSFTASVHTSTSPTADDEVYYERALEEFDTNRRKGLWIKLLTQNEGDEVKSKFKYIKVRVLEIQLEDTDQNLKNQTNLIAVKKEGAAYDKKDLASAKADNNYNSNVYQEVSSTQIENKFEFTENKDSYGLHTSQKTGSLGSSKEKFQIKFKFDYQHRSILYIASQAYILTNDENARDACISTCTVMNKNDLFEFVEYLLSISIENSVSAADQRKRAFIEKVDRIMIGNAPTLTANYDNSWMEAIASKNIDAAYNLFNSAIIKSA